MDKIYSGIYIDFDRNRLLSTVNVKQFEDRGRWIRIHLLKNGEPMELLGNETLSLSASVDNIVTAFEYSKPEQPTRRHLIYVLRSLSQHLNRKKFSKLQI